MSSTFPPGQTGSEYDPSVSGITGDTSIGYESDAQLKQSTTASLRDNLSNLKGELDSLLSRAGTLTESELNQAYVQLMSKFGSIRFAAKNVAQQATRQFNQGVDVTKTYVQDRPLQSVAIAAGVGVAFGMLLGRR